ncbi:hypothetical protein FRC01_002443 [Tulasnella sp. 417]|nr:hypothetical protein FRC01_002443 [Tulasnella sp. 417]
MSDTPPPDEGLNKFIQDLIDDPLSLGDREARESLIFTPNIVSGQPSPSGCWRWSNSTEVATVHLFGWVHSESMLGPYGSMEHARLTLANMARQQKQILVHEHPSPKCLLHPTKEGGPARPGLETCEHAPQNQTHGWITSAGGNTYINLSSKLWQDVDSKGKTGGSLLHNFYGRHHTSSAPSFDNYTMVTWPNPNNYDYARDPHCSLKALETQTSNGTFKSVDAGILNAR